MRTSGHLPLAAQNLPASPVGDLDEPRSARDPARNLLRQLPGWHRLIDALGGGGKTRAVGRNLNPQRVLQLEGEIQSLLRNSEEAGSDRKSTRLNSSHSQISYAVFCLKKKKK